jgi:ABC-type multidrug transport system fused ATPase/permease subunit
MAKPKTKPFNPAEFVRSRFSIQSVSLWRVMKLLRPHRRRIILANVMSSFSTTMAGLCLLALHPLFQLTMDRPAQDGSGTTMEGESFYFNTDFGMEQGGEAKAEGQDVSESEVGDSASAGKPPASNGPVAARFEGIRKLTKKISDQSPLAAQLINRTTAGWTGFVAWARESPVRMISIYLSFIVFLYLLSQFFSFLGSYILGQVSLSVTMKMMQDIYANVLRQEYNFFNTNTTGSLLNVCNRQVLQLRSIVSFLVSTRIMTPVNMLIMFGVLVGISFRLSMLLLMFLPLVIFPALFLVRRMKQSMADEIDQESGSMEVMSEGLQGILAIKAFGAEQLEQESLKPAIAKYVRSNRKRQAAQSLMGPVVDFMNMMVLLIVFVLTMFVMRGAMAVDQSRIILFLFAVTRFHKPLRTLLTMNLEMQRSAQVAHRLFELLDREPEIREQPEAVDFPGDWREIVLDDVSLIYFAKGRKTRSKETEAERRLRMEARALREAEERLKHMRTPKQEQRRLEKKAVKKQKRQQQEERPALVDVDLRIRRGEKIALIGPNGAGKSSLVNLLCRLYDPTEGEVRIDALNYEDIRLSEIHRHVCLVTQHPVLFNRSVRDNIAFGLEGLSDEKIEAAARMTGAHVFISNLPDGYNTLVGEGGRHISGGERQKVALARAFVRDPEILILDEPTTGLDYQTAREFLDVVFHPRHEHLTLIFITHEPSQLSRFERILRLTPEKKIVDEPLINAGPIELQHEPVAGQ